MADTLHGHGRTGLGSVLQRSVSAVKRALGFQTQPDFERMTDEEFNRWREDFLFRINMQLAWSNYVRSAEAQPLIKQYERFSNRAFYLIFVSIFVLVPLPGIFVPALAFEYRPLIAICMILAAIGISLPVDLYARKRYPLKPLQYAIDNFWPTTDSDPRTDISALPPEKETVATRFGRGLWVTFWMVQILWGLTILHGILQR